MNRESIWVISPFNHSSKNEYLAKIASPNGQSPTALRQKRNGGMQENRWHPALWKLLAAQKNRLQQTFHMDFKNLFSRFKWEMEDSKSRRKSVVKIDLATSQDKREALFTTGRIVEKGNLIFDSWQVARFTEAPPADQSKCSRGCRGFESGQTQCGRWSHLKSSISPEEYVFAGFNAMR